MCNWWEIINFGGGFGDFGDVETGGGVKLKVNGTVEQRVCARSVCTWYVERLKKNH